MGPLGWSGSALLAYSLALIVPPWVYICVLRHGFEPVVMVRGCYLVMGWIYGSAIPILGCIAAFA
jgi:hypothetical protein